MLSLRWAHPVSILYKSTAGRYRPVSYPDGPITARCRFIKNASWGAHAFLLVLLCGGSIRFDIYIIYIYIIFRLFQGGFSVAVLCLCVLVFHMWRLFSFVIICFSFFLVWYLRKAEVDKTHYCSWDGMPIICTCIGIKHGFFMH